MQYSENMNLHSQGVCFGRDFTGYIFDRIQNKENQTVQCKLRPLNKTYNLVNEKSINSARVKIQNLESLAKICLLTAQIQNLKIEFPFDEHKHERAVRRDYYNEHFNGLRFLSVQQFPNLQSVNFLFDKKMIIGFSKLWFRISLEENFSIHGLNVTSNLLPISKRVFMIINSQNHDVNIDNVKFNGLGLGVYNAQNIKIINSKFQNAGCGIWVGSCQSTNIEQINTENCIYYGVLLGRLSSDFKLGNACIKNCGVGLQILQSNGKVENLVIENSSTGVAVVQQSMIRYEHIRFVNNISNVIVQGESSFMEEI